MIKDENLQRSTISEVSAEGGKKGIMERKFQRDGLTCTKAQGPKTPSHVVLLEYEMEIGVEADFIGGKEGTNAKRARL